MNTETYEYAIVIEKTLALLVMSSNLQHDRNSDDHKVELFRGATVQIKAHQKQQNSYKVVMICDFYQNNVTFQHNLYYVKSSALQCVDENIWLQMVAIVDPQERANIVKDKAYIDYLSSLKLSSFVGVKSQHLSMCPIRQSLQFLPEREIKDSKNQDFDCIIRYIGFVNEIGPGYYYGLELLNLTKGYSPQESEIAAYSRNYVDCEPNIAFILPANFIQKPVSRTLKKNNRSSEANQSVISSLFCGFKDRVNYRNNKTLPSKRHSYIDSVDSASSEFSSSSSVKRSITPNYDDGKMNSISSSSSNSAKIPSSISSPNLAKQDSASSSTSSSNRLFNSDLLSEEYSRTMAERERRNEERERRTSGSRGTQTPSSGSSANGDISRTPKSKKKTVMLPTAPNREIKPSTILRLEDRDLVVIDRQDIKEAVRNESDVIIVDPPPMPPTPNDGEQQHADLSDILGTQWPELAGSSAALLNNDKKGNSSNTNGWRTVERNKSSNIASHLSSSSKSQQNGYRKKHNGNNNQFELLDQDSISSTDQISDCLVPSPLIDIPGTSLELGSLVEVTIESGKNLHGVIRWIGKKHQDELKMSNGYASNELLVGVELDETCNERGLRLTDGVYNGQRCFRCPDRRAIFVSPKQCTKDRRFHEDSLSKSPTVRSNTPSDGKAFGAECPIIEGAVSALKFVDYEDLESQCGKFKGIQGHHNSCYLDATLFAMFTFTSVFDSVLFRPREAEDNEQYEEVQRVLREEIVNPLRKNLFVRADRVLKLRKLLDKLTSVKGLVNEEKDPEEFLNSLLAQILRAEPFLKLSSGLDAFYYQLFIEKDEKLTLPTVQQLFEQSFLTSDIKLKEVPSCLIIQMPRFGKSYRMYPRILPSQVLDVTDVIEDSPRQCTICGNLAEFECKECYGVLPQSGSGLESTAFCKTCLQTVHSHHKRLNHTPKPLSIPHDFKILSEYNQVPRLFMELFAVICIETSHYVAFVKAGSGLDAPWVFFDSMADRKGEQNGYNIPEMVPVPELPLWLSEEGSRQLHEANIHDKHLPEFAKRLLCDAYLMLYQSTEMMMYR